MSSGRRLEGSDSESDWSEDELDRERYKKFTSVVGGTPRSKKHREWAKGRRAAAKEAAAQKSEMSKALPELDQETSKIITNSSLDKDKTPVRKPIVVYSEGRKEKQLLEATFDSGTPENWISRQKAMELNFRIEVVKTSMYYTFTGETLRSSEIVKDIRWCSADGSEPSARSRYTTFRIAPDNAPFVVLFGHEFIFSKEIFSFNEAALILTKVGESSATKKTKEGNRKDAEAEAEALAREREAAAAANVASTKTK